MGNRTSERIFELFINRIYICMETGNRYEAEVFMSEAEDILTAEQVHDIKEAVYADYHVHL